VRLAALRVHRLDDPREVQAVPAVRGVTLHLLQQVRPAHDLVDAAVAEAREELTASLKVRRANVLSNYADLVEEIYARAIPKRAKRGG